MNESKSLVTRQELTPQLWDMLGSVGAAFHKSGRMSIINPEEGMVKALFCMENGLPLTAARGLYFVNGKLGIESGVIAAMLRQHPDYDYTIERLDPMGCTIAVSRYGEVIGEASFTMDDAERAGLAQKHTYKSYPEDVLFARAITRAQRRYAPDVFGAPVYSSEGMQDWVVDGEVVEQTPARPKSPGVVELTEKYGADACIAAGVFAATTEGELWRAIDQLSVVTASDESDRLDKERAETVPPTLKDVKEEIEADQSPFKEKAK